MATAAQSTIVAFGRFQVLPGRRELLADGQPIKLGGRAYDVLLALIEAHGAVVSKDELIARVWPGRVVEENALQAQISALRAALQGERELIRTVAGRGYQFIGDVRPLSANETPSRSREVGVVRPHPTNLSEPVSELIGRDGELQECLNLITGHRLVTLTGPGGIGKTRLALAAAHELLPEFPQGVWLVEFSLLSDPNLVPTLVATAIGLELGAGEIGVRRVAQAISAQRLLLVLDTCEHVVAVAAELAEAVLRAGSAAHVLATSREPLKTEAEWVYPVSALDVPAEDATDGGSLLRYGGVRLFLERALAVEPRFAPDQRQIGMIAAVCRRLDGIPLAIEFAAARAATLGVEVVAARLDDRFSLLARGRRTALPRHQTLRATLDWSYELLSESEQIILRRLSVFAGPFGLEAACAVASSPAPQLAPVVDSLVHLVTKSLLAVEIGQTITRYRILDTTRAYAREKLEKSGELNEIARRHADYCKDRLERAKLGWSAQSPAEWLADYGRDINDLRAALDWTFSPDGEPCLGVALTVASGRLWFSLSFMDECCTRVQRALLSLKASASGNAVDEMRLRAILALALFNTQGPGAEALATWTDVLEIAERLNSDEYRLRALWGLWYHHISNGDCHASLALAHRYCTLTPNQADPLYLLSGQRLLGTSLYYLGELGTARQHLERLLNNCTPPVRRSHIVQFQFDLPAAARGTLLRVLWLQGFPDQAKRMAEDTVEDALAIDDVVSLYWALDAACMIGLAVGDLQMTEHSLAMLLGRSSKSALGFWQALGHSYEGQLLISKGDFATGVSRFRTGLDQLRETRYLLRAPGLLGVLAAGLAGLGEVAEAEPVIEEALALCERTGERWSIAELLRIKGDIFLLKLTPDAKAAEAQYRQGLELARKQGALSWELRCAACLARLWRDLGRSHDGLELLQPIHDRFTEGFDTTDLAAAKALLGELR